MAKSYESKVKAFKATCSNMAQLITNQVKFQISQENAQAAGQLAHDAARYAFQGDPGLREEMVLDPSKWLDEIHQGPQPHGGINE